MLNNVTFVIQIEGYDSFIGQADLFCYSLNKFYPNHRAIVLCNKDPGISRNNTTTVVVPDTIYPILKKKAENKTIIAIKRFTYLKEFLNMGHSFSNQEFVILTDPDTAFINRSKFLDSFNGTTKNIMGVGPSYMVPQTTLKYFSAKSGGKDYQLYSAPIGFDGSNTKAVCDTWLKIWEYYVNDPEMFTPTEKFDHGYGYLLEMMPVSIVAKQLGLNVVQMFKTYYDELMHYFHPFDTCLPEGKTWCKRKIDWSRPKVKKIEYKHGTQNCTFNYIDFYKLFNEWVDNYKTRDIITP